ncbi:unnamed protein product [Adineta ricciae]|uniref:Uncharacterized protein n=1 Tax=Adineta ricciae TaxID=249248 RepID=A0A813YAQ7_ADIRI|nr:unnamed protein product [Adineta ricciae]CAF1401956.1 unnamed protein product [Adineta ricciae]
MADKFKKFKIDLDLSASILSGLAKPSGSFKFLTESPKTSHIVQASIFYREIVRSKQFKEVILNNNKKLNELITFKRQPIEATHIVIGVIYGFCVSANFERRVEKNENKCEVEGKLKVMLTEVKALSSGSGEASAEYKQTSTISKNSFHVKIYTDIKFTNQLPQTVDESLAFFKDLPKSMEKMTSQAKPIEYILYPINNFKRQLKISIDGLDSLLVSQGTLCKIQLDADRLLEIQQKYADYFETYGSVSVCISDATRKCIGKRHVELLHAQVAYREMLSENLVKVRSNNIDERTFLEQINTSCDKLVQMHEQSYSQNEQIHFLRTASDRGCILVDNNTTESLMLSEYGEKEQDLFIGVINDHLIVNDDASWKLFMRKFTDLMHSRKDNVKFILRNDNLDPTTADSKLPTNFSILHYYDRKLIRTELININDNLHDTKQYCHRCGAEDNEERFVAFGLDPSVRPTPDNNYTGRVSQYGKVISCESLIQYGATSLKYSAGVHRIEFQILSCESKTLQFHMNMIHRYDDISRIEIKFGAPILSTENLCEVNDIFELTIDCDAYKVVLVNRRTRWTQAIGVDTDKYPLPWACLFRHSNAYLRTPKVQLRINKSTHERNS